MFLQGVERAAWGFVDRALPAHSFFMKYLVVSLGEKSKAFPPNGGFYFLLICPNKQACNPEGYAVFLVTVAPNGAAVNQKASGLLSRFPRDFGRRSETRTSSVGRKPEDAFSMILSVLEPADFKKK